MSMFSLSPVYQLESVVAGFQALAAYQGALAFGQGIAAQAGFREMVHEQAVQAAEALSSLGSTDGARFVAGLQGPDHESVYQEMAAVLTGLQARLRVFRETSDRSLREEMTRLHRLVGGPAQLFGLSPPVRLGQVAPAVPEWAREVRLVYTGGGKKADRERTINLGPDGVAVIGGGPFSAAFGGSPHSEISYQHGRFWIRDLTTLTGTFLNGRRLPPDVWWPVRSQDRVMVGSLLPKKFRVVFPDTPMLATLEEFIANADSLEALAELLQMNGQPELALQIDRHLRYDEDFSNLPAEGGLEAKVLELVLARRFDRLRGQYLEGLREETTRAILEPLADAIERATTPEELCGALRKSLLPSGFSIAWAIERYFRGEESLDAIPTALGIRAKVEALTKGLRAELQRRGSAIEALESERSGLEDEARLLRLQVEEKAGEVSRFQDMALRAEATLESARRGAEEVLRVREARIAELEALEQRLVADLAAARRTLSQRTAAPTLFGGADPRVEKVKVSVKGESTLVNARGELVGGAHIVAGGEEGETRWTLDEGSLLSAKTTIGISKSRPPRQEDGYYAARFKLPDGTPVKVMVVADGAGGMGSGDVASSAFLQGIHARVAAAAAQGAAELLAGDLAASGVAAVKKQIELGAADGTASPGATGSCAVIVVVGNQATIATAADATVLYSKAMPDGSRRVVSYSAADYMEVNGPHGPIKRITAGIHKEAGFHYYVVNDVGDGDSFTTGSDGFHENVHPEEYKIQVSPGMRDHAPQVRGQHLQHPTRATFQTVSRMLTAVAGREEAAAILHDAAFEVMRQYQGGAVAGPITFHLLGQEMQTTAKPGRDNIVVGHLQHASTGSAPRPAPAGYEALPDVVEVMQQTEPFPPVNLTFQPDQTPTTGDFLVLGRNGRRCDGFIDHPSVSRRHGHLVRNAQAKGQFQADTWYYQPIADNPNGDLHNGTAVARNQWIALADGDQLRMGGFPFVVSINPAGAITFSTDPSPPPPSPPSS